MATNGRSSHLDQALCVGGGYIFEAVNNAIAVYDTTGTRIALDSLDHFFGYPVEIDRTTGTPARSRPRIQPVCSTRRRTGFS